MLENHIHVVLGEEYANRLLARDPRGEPHQLGALARSHAGGRLVHQEQLRLVRQRHRQFQPLQIAIGKLPAGAVGIAGHPDQLQQAAGFLTRQLRRRRPQIEELSAMGDQRDLDVLAHGHGGKRGRDLEGASDAQPPDLARRTARGVLAEQRNPAAVRDPLTVEHIEAGAFACTVWTDQREYLAPLQFKGHAAHGVNAAIGFGQAFDRQKCGSAAHSADSALGVSTVDCDDGRR